jgi:hypothetical protein
MWLCTKFGFYSITRKKDSEWHIRGRSEQDLLNIKDACELKEPVIRTAPADYRWRIVVEDKSTMDKVFQLLCETLDYSNFKGKVGKTPDQNNKLGIYHGWWDDMYAFQSTSEAGQS